MVETPASCVITIHVHFPDSGLFCTHIHPITHPMPLQNRVNPFGEICQTPHRGQLMGNRGCLHNDRQQLVRSFQLQRWIICVLEFKGWHRQVMRPGHYTELFFWDEATGLAAGHRPCAECQRPRYRAFIEAWQTANGYPGCKTPEMDAVLHAERCGGTPLHAHVTELPDGVFVAHEGQAHLIFRQQAYRWSFAGYAAAPSPEVVGPCRVLTPPSTVAAIRAGFVPGIVW